MCSVVRDFGVYGQYCERLRGIYRQYCERLRGIWAVL